MRLTLDPVRISLLAALGLLACGPNDKNTTGESDGDTTDGMTTGSMTTGSMTTGSMTTGSVTTTDPTTTDNPATDSVTSTPVTDTGVMTGGSTDTDDTTGETDTTSVEETGAVGCDTAAVPAEQGFTDPPVPSGFETCNGGLLHRVERVTCDVPMTPSSCMDNVLGGCTTDADCKDKPFGSCQQDMVFGGFTEGTCSCVYGCATDEDCADTEICRCAGQGLGLYTECIEAGCKDDSECPDGEICALSPDLCAPGGFLTACTTPNDTCESQAECLSPPCSFNIDKWECANVACGRPFLVESQAVVAPLCARDDWRALQRVPALDLGDASLAPRLAAYWSQLGQLEHASIAAFAQFVLHLLAVGAPPTLVLAGQRALADEVEHARLCFGLASLYAGAAVGPGPLAIGGGASTDRAALVDAVIREACIGETLAAFEAREAAAQATDPAVRATLEKIASDELRHAELGWQFIQWALVDDEAVARARATFTAAIAEARRGVARDARTVGTPELQAHGVIDAPLRAQIWAEGLRAVIEPCAAALLDRRAA